MPMLMAIGNPPTLAAGATCARRLPPDTNNVAATKAGAKIAFNCIAILLGDASRKDFRDGLGKLSCKHWTLLRSILEPGREQSRAIDGPFCFRSLPRIGQEVAV